MMRTVFLLFVLAGTILGCEEQLDEPPTVTNVSIATKFIDSDSISRLSSLIDTTSASISSLTEQINENQVVIDSLRRDISEDPDNEQIPEWEAEVEKREAIKTDLTSTRTPLQTSLTSLSGKRDSLRSGYSYLISVTNLASGNTVTLDTLLNLYNLPLDFNRSLVRYRIELEQTTREIEVNYSLREEINLSGITRLIIEDLTITENEFDSLIFDDEVYSFLY